MIDTVMPPTPIPSSQGGGEARDNSGFAQCSHAGPGTSLPPRGGGMGWGGLFAILIPSNAFAEVCDKVRAEWVPSLGPVSFWDELLESVQSIPVALLGVAALLLWQAPRSALLLFSAFAIVTSWVLHPFPEPSWSVIDAAREEGCIGPNLASLLPYIGLATIMLARAATLSGKPRLRP